MKNSIKTKLENKTEIIENYKTQIDEYKRQIELLQNNSLNFTILKYEKIQLKFTL
jgi:hypothetical protein